MKTKKCPVCKKRKSLSKFGFLKKWNRPQWECKKCASRRACEWNKNHPDKVSFYNRKHGLKRKYNLELEDFIRLQTEQNHLCLICEGPLIRLNIDHDHQTGKVRGLLCGFCNSLLGFARDDKKILRAAIAYLEKHNKTKNQNS